MLILRNKGFHEFVLTVLPQSLCNTLMDLLNSAFASKLFVSKDSLILCLCMLDNLASVFGCSQLNQQWQSLECSVAPDTSHFPVQLIEWAHIFLFLQCIPSHNHNSMTLHLVFQSFFLILGPIIGVHGSLTMLLSVFSVLGAWCLFSLIIEYHDFGHACSQQTYLQENLDIFRT